MSEPYLRAEISEERMKFIQENTGMDYFGEALGLTVERMEYLKDLTVKRILLRDLDMSEIKVLDNPTEEEREKVDKVWPHKKSERFARLIEVGKEEELNLIELLFMTDRMEVLLLTQELRNQI